MRENIITHMFNFTYSKDEYLINIYFMYNNYIVFIKIIALIQNNNIPEIINKTEINWKQKV